MIYVDVSEVARYLKAAKPMTGIQRLTLISLVGLNQILGEDGVSALVFDEALNDFRALSCKAFFAGEKGQRPKFTADDKLLFMEWYWNHAAFEATLKVGKSEGAKHFRFLHDVIPVARPDFVRPENARRFRLNTERAIAAADVVLTNSDYSKTDILKHFQIAAERPIAVVKLAHEFMIVERNGEVISVCRDTQISDDKIRPEIAALQGQKFAVMVGTLEARKNSMLAVKAWHRLARKNASNANKLVMVGRYSAHSLSYTVRLWLRMKLSKTVVHFMKCSDWELAWLYQHCQFTIYISQYEGWGLPIGESLWFGKRVVTQHVTSLPEAGGAAADYVVANDIAAQVDLLQKLFADAALPKSHELVRWVEFANKLMRQFF